MLKPRFTACREFCEFCALISRPKDSDEWQSERKSMRNMWEWCRLSTSLVCRTIYYLLWLLWLASVSTKHRSQSTLFNNIEIKWQVGAGANIHCVRCDVATNVLGSNVFSLFNGNQFASEVPGTTGESKKNLIWTYLPLTMKEKCQMVIPAVHYAIYTRRHYYFSNESVYWHTLTLTHEQLYSCTVVHSLTHSILFCCTNMNLFTLAYWNAMVEICVCK